MFCRKPVYVMGAECCTWKLSEFHKSLRERGVVRPFTGSEDVSEYLFEFCYYACGDQDHCKMMLPSCWSSINSYRSTLADRGWGLGKKLRMLKHYKLADDSRFLFWGDPSVLFLPHTLFSCDVFLWIQLIASAPAFWLIWLRVGAGLKKREIKKSRSEKTKLSLLYQIYSYLMFF